MHIPGELSRPPLRWRGIQASPLDYGVPFTVRRKHPEEDSHT